MSKQKFERKYLALKAKKESSDEECLTSGSEDEECHGSERLQKFLQEKRKICKMTSEQQKDVPKNLECLKPPKDKNQKAFVEVSWSDSGEEDDEKIKDETCLVAHVPNEVCSDSSTLEDEKLSIEI
ncbi:hypothetical protein Tco_1230054 [Tanacetum coccineum]